jgi:hypothetical protein
VERVGFVRDAEVNGMQDDVLAVMPSYVHVTGTP